VKPVLETINLTKSFHHGSDRSFKAVDDVSFCLYPGESLGIVGESGSGKSTVARLITRLVKPTSGDVLIDGQNLNRMSPGELREVYGRIQMVFQDPVSSFDPRKTLGSGIGESLRNRGFKKQEIEERTAALLEQCGLPPSYAARYPHEVSGGECQRAAIARALAIEPEILICDEATSALDVTVQQQILELLMQLKQTRSLSFLFICHNLALVQLFCDRVLVMYDGKIVETGTPDEIINEPGEEYTRNLVDSVL
jgi:oligopeptide transport system ATP-binding protein